MGCGESGADHMRNTNLSERQCYMCRKIAKENRVVKVRSKPLEGDQVSTMAFNNKPDEERESPLWMSKHKL